MKITIEVLQDGDLSFYRKVSSEENYDYLKFIIDGSEVESWSGNVDWTQETYSITAGTHTIEWSYSKDGSVADGLDLAFVDDIVFPPFGSVEVTVNTENSLTFDVELSVFPVPFTTNVNFKYFTKNSDIFRVNIYDISGKTVYSGKQNSVAGENIFFWNNCGQLNSGLYLYQISIGNQMFSGKLIKN